MVQYHATPHGEAVLSGARWCARLVRRWIGPSLRRVYKLLMHIATSKCELERICDSGAPPEQMAHAYAVSLRRSRQLREIAAVVFRPEPFDPDRVADDIVARKHMPLARYNSRECLVRINWCNQAFAEMQLLANTPYNSSNPDHEERLEALWAALKPGVRRAGGRVTKEWGEIGFQGTDPATDFRGMGFLGLLHLVYYARMHNFEAMRSLADSNHPTRWYPFAITGINLTQFVLQLLEQRRLDRRLLRSFDVMPSEQLSPAQTAVAEIYSELFTEFNDTWVAWHVSDVMQFPLVFGTFKERVMERYSGLDGL